MSVSMVDYGYNQASRAFGVATKSVDTLIKHGKVIEAFNSISDVFFSTKMPYADTFKELFKTLKGCNALATLPQQAITTARNVYCFVTSLTLNNMKFCIGSAAGLINKAYDAASFLEKEIAVPFFKGVSEKWKATHFQAVGVGAAIRFMNAAPAAMYSLSHESLRDSLGSYRSGPIFQTIESLSSMVFAGSILTGAGAQIATAASAIGAFTKGAEYYWTGAYNKSW